MNVTSVQYDFSTLLSTTVGMLSQSSSRTSLSSALADVYQQSSSTSNTYQSNSYSALGRSAASTFTPIALQGLGVTMNQTAAAFAVQAGSARETEEWTATLNTAVEALDAGNTDETRRIAQELLDEDGTDASAAHVMGRAYLADNDYDNAEKYFSRAAMMAPSSDRFASDLATVRMLRQSDDEVLVEAERMIRQPDRRLEGIRLLSYVADRSPDNIKAHTLLGDALMGEALAGGAVSSYRNALIAADSDDELNPLLERFRDLAEAAPDVGVTHSLLGQALQKSGNYAEALVELQRAANILPENTSYQDAVAGVYSDMGNEALEDGKASDAIRYFEQAMAIDPLSDNYKGGLARAKLEDAKWWISRGVEDKAFLELNAAKVLIPDGEDKLGQDVSKAFNMLGDRYRADDELDWAVSSYKRAHELDSSNYTYRSKLAQAYEARGTELFGEGEYEQAETYYQNALDLFPSSDNYTALVQAAQDAQEE